MIAAARFVSPTLDQILALLRAGADRARLPRGHRAARARPLLRARARTAARRALPRRRERRPVRRGCAAFADATARGQARMIIGEEHAVDELWAEARGADAARRATTGRASRCTCSTTRPSRGRPASARRRSTTSTLLVPACAAAHREEIGIDPLRRDPEGFRWRTRSQIEEGRSWIWLEDGVICFKAEASAWTPSAVQLQQVWVDPTLAEPRLRETRDARPLPAAARARAGGVPLRPAGERRGDPRLRGDRDAAHDLVPLADLLKGGARHRLRGARHPTRRLVVADAFLSCAIGGQSVTRNGSRLPL